MKSTQPKPEADQQTLAAVVVEREDVDLVRVEKNLQSVGFFASTPSKEISRTVIQIIRRPDGQRIQAKAVIEGVPSLGLPTTADRDKYMAFMKVAMDQRDQQGQVANPVRFSGAELIKLLRLRKGGFHYDEINDWCKRMVATIIMSESSIFLADRRQYASDTFHVFDRVVLFGEEMNDGVRSEFYEVYLSQWQLNNLNQGYMLPLDFNAYLKLSRDIAKALFGHLSVWFYASKGQPVEKKYQDFCQLLHIRAYPHISKARSVLQPSLDELVEIGYLSSWEIVHTSQGGDFKLVLSPGNRLLSLPSFVGFVTSEGRAALQASLPNWVGELIERGVAERKARQLALDIPDSQPVMDQIEYADSLILNDRRGKLQNPAGFYIWAIESNLGVPEEFETSHRRQVRQQSEQADLDAQQRHWRLMEKYELDIERLIEEKITRMTAERLADAIKEQTRKLRREQPDFYQRSSETTRREVALGMLRSNLRESSSLPAFEQWLKANQQLAMF